MTHTSPTTFAVWSVLSTALGAFLLGHLYRFDKFKCLKWSNAPYSGAFKRIMTYSYLVTIPLIMTYSFGFTYIKYKEGFIDIGGTILPKPYTFWGENYRRAIFPLMMVFSFSWSFEMVTHLEELCFWYFLINAGPAQPDWFHSLYFRIWIVGSVAAVVYLPAVTIVYRNDPLGCEARMFTSGSVGDLILTLMFIPILLRFPNFIRKVKAEGVDSGIVVRLYKFYELNVIRIIFRFLMQIPLFTLGVDGLRPHHHVNESLFWTDLLSIVAALGCVFSSVCTLLIFFPRSYEAEYAAKEASHRRSMHSLSSRQSHEPQPAYSQYGDDFEDRFDDFEPASSSMDKSTTFKAMQKYSDGRAPYEDDNDDFVKYERRERKMKIGNGLVRERFRSKLRERDRRIERGKKRIGVGLQEALARRLTRFSISMPMSVPRPRRRHAGVGVEGSGTGANAISLSLARNLKEGDDTVTRRTTPSARSAVHRRSGSAAMMSEEETGATLERKGTYLLTDSPVLRARRLEWERERREMDLRAAGAAGAGAGAGAGASVETLKAAYEASAGAGARATGADTSVPISTSPIDMDIVEIGLAYGTIVHGVSRNYRLDEVKDSDVAFDDFMLTTTPRSPPPTSSAAPSYSQAAATGGLVNLPSPVHTSTSPTALGHILGPRPIKKSLSVSTTATVGTGTRRALPAPPVSGGGDPLGAAPAYYPPENPPPPPIVPTPNQTLPHQDHGERRQIGTSAETQTQSLDKNTIHTRSIPATSKAIGIGIGDMSTHPFASATAPLDRQERVPVTVPTAVAPLAPPLPTNANTSMPETSDAQALPISLSSRWPGDASLPGEIGNRPGRCAPGLNGPVLRTNNASATGPGTAPGEETSGIGIPPLSTGPGPGPGPGLGLTAANVARFNWGISGASRTSQVNPLVRTFTSPIDFMDRIHEDGDPASAGGAGANGNASRTQLGWAV